MAAADLQVVEAVGRQVIPDLLHHLVGILVGNRANVDLHLGGLGHTGGLVDLVEEQALDVHGGLGVQLVLQGLAGEAADEVVNAVALQSGLFLIDGLMDKLLLIIRQLSDGVVEMADGDIVICILHGVQRPDQPPHGAGAVLGMAALDGEGGHALDAHVDDQGTVGDTAAAFPHDAVGLDLIHVVMDELH